MAVSNTEPVHTLLSLPGTMLFLLFLLGRPALSTTAPESTARTFLQQLALHQFSDAAAAFDSTVSAALPPDKLAAVWDSLTTQFGAFDSIRSATTEEQTVILNCHFQKADLDARIVFDNAGKIAGLWFAPASTASTGWSCPPYANPSSFHEQSITVVNKEWRLPGTLTLPNGPGPFPAVVLVHGSGPNDEDETIGPNKIFKDLAWGLATRGIAVLRYEKRTHRYHTALTPNFSVNDETVDDARAAVALLPSQPAIDARRIFVLGHSLGGTVAPRIAQNDRQVAGLIILAGATRPLAQILVEQLKYLSSLHGTPTEAETQQIRAAEESERQINSPTLRPGDTVPYAGASLPGSYFLDLRSYHPAETAATLKIPILVLQGGRDYQVTMADFDTWKTALASDPRASFRLYPQLTHLFIPSTSPGTGPGTPADYAHPDHVALSVISDIAEWVSSASGTRSHGAQ